MALAEHAKLAVDLTLNDHLSGPAGKAAGSINKLSTSTKGTTAGLAKVEGAAHAGSRGLLGLGGAFSAVGQKTEGLRHHLEHTKHTLGELVSGPLGMIGLGAGVLSVGVAIDKGVEKASELGIAVEKLTSLTGDSAEHMSALLAVFEKFGIGSDQAGRALGFLEKNVGLMSVNSKLAKKFTDEFGVSIRDASGHVKSANTLLLEAADYWNGTASHAQKAAFESKLFGRSYAELIPVLRLGSKGIKDAEEEAGKLGLTLNKTNVKDLAKFREATRSMGDAVGGLQLQIGLALVPALTTLAKTASAFVAQNRTKIVGFFRDGVKFAQQFGKVIQTNVVPLFKGIASGWNALPKPLKDLLITGLVAGKVSKVLFGFGPLDFLKAGGGLLGKIGGELFKRGATPAAPLYVKDVTAGLGGAAGAAGATGGKLGVLGKVALVGEAIGLVAAVEGVRESISAGNSALASQVHDQTTAFIASKPNNAALESSLAGIDKGIADIQSNPLNVLVQGDALDQLKAMRAAVASQLANNKVPTLGEHANDRTVAAVNKANATIGRGIIEGHRDTDKLDGSVRRTPTEIAAAKRATVAATNAASASARANAARINAGIHSSTAATVGANHHLAAVTSSGLAHLGAEVNHTTSATKAASASARANAALIRAGIHSTGAATVSATHALSSNTGRGLAHLSGEVNRLPPRLARAIPKPKAPIVRLTVNQRISLKAVVSARSQHDVLVTASRYGAVYGSGNAQ